MLENWRFKQMGEKAWYPACVPGCVHTDLLKNKLIVDPFYGDYEKDLQWIDKVDWCYETTLHVTEEMLVKQMVLIFHGLDTYADIYLNDVLVKETANMFRIYKLPIRHLVTRGENRLRIVFKSPIQMDLPKLHALGYQLPAVNDDSDMGGLGDKKLSIFARKAPFHYGWDWGPRFVTSGIYKPVELMIYEELMIEDLYIRMTTVEEHEAIGEVEIALNVAHSGIYTFTLHTESYRMEKTYEVQEGHQTITLPVTIKQPKRWYTHDLGEPYMYTFTLTARDEKRLIAHKQLKTGLRKVRLITDKDQAGTSFYFELNDQPLFIKGANHIPNDSFVSEVTDQRYQKEIDAALFAGMNMLRVWGGGIYEMDVFYEKCDAAGILVWQDFMFACSMYPGDEAFVANVKQEAIDQVKRLRHHPSIALWCGNNEMDAAWAHYEEDGGWGWKKPFSNQQREKIWSDYQKIFHGVLKETVAKYTTEDYWSSSPLRSEIEDVSRHAFTASNAGDVHYWDVWHGKKPFEAYHDNVGRFMSEYGFQSFPEKRTIDTFLTEKDYAIDSQFMLHHQKNGDGNHLIETYMSEALPKPKDFEGYLYLSQVLQQEAIKQAIEAHRKAMPYCMGTLYWQLNDCWPVASWSSIDYFGRYKALHYQVRESYQRQWLVMSQEDDCVMIHGINDGEAISGELIVSLTAIDGEVHFSESLPITLDQYSSACLKTYNYVTLLEGVNRKDVVLTVTFKGVSQAIEVTNRHYFVKTKALPLKEGTVMVQKMKPYVYHVSSEVFQKAVRLEASIDGHFSANYFDLLPNEVKEVVFYPADVDQLIKVDAKGMASFIV